MNSVFKSFRTLPVLLASSAVIYGCSAKNTTYDEHAGLSKKDYQEVSARRNPEVNYPSEFEPAIPELQPIIASPMPPALSDGRRVTVDITDKTELRDVLIELARKADVDLEMDPRIKGGIFFSAKDRPLKEVFHRISDLAGLRYSFENNILRIELDEPYLHSYRVSAISSSRSSEGEVSISTDVFSAVGGGGAAGNTSTSKISMESTINAWEEITANIEEILSKNVKKTILVPVKAAAPVATPVQQASMPQTPQGFDELNNPNSALTPLSDNPMGGAPTPPPLPDGMGQRGSIAAPPPPPVAAAGDDNEDKQFFTINKQAGIINVYTTQAQQKKIKRYLDEINSSLNSQVLIEAKIIEVNLTDEYRTGVNWSILSENVQGSGDSAIYDWGLSALTGKTLAFPLSAGAENIGTAGMKLSHDAGNFTASAIADLLSKFGTVRTLSSPRITAMNNQAAILKIAKNEVYFKVEIETEEDESGNEDTEVTSELKTVPIGVVMTVQPSIDETKGQITMHLRPTISRIVSWKADPGVALIAAKSSSNVESLVPVVEVREIDSVVTLGTGQAMIMGGLMRERVVKNENGIPGLEDTPIAGELLFKSKTNSTEMTELVIFLKATIVKDRDTITPADEDTYLNFAPDPRPLAF
ncbi:MAG: hypothetical protein GY804_08195 [Alphaproteobacteria bacterium]|nr:hypothetical protein [Alphaproteobacteria bacterium]